MDEIDKQTEAQVLYNSCMAIARIENTEEEAIETLIEVLITALTERNLGEHFVSKKNGVKEEKKEPDWCFVDVPTQVLTACLKMVSPEAADLFVHRQVPIVGRPRTPRSCSLDDLPRTVAFTLHQGSFVTSMEFHPFHSTLLLVGSSSAEITLWDVASREKLVSKTFKVWDSSSCSLQFQAAFVKDIISVNRVAWSPDGNYVGAAFSKHMIHLYAYSGPNGLHQQLEIDAHVGGVNDLGFAYVNKQLYVITCGDDKLIKVWDLSGRKSFNLEGHEAPVYSICPHHKENDFLFIISTAFDGKIKVWLYDTTGSKVDWDAPGHWCTTMLYSADGTRLFSCGTSKKGNSFLVEWNESKGAIKATYTGFRRKSKKKYKRKSNGVVQFDTTKDRYLAAGEDQKIKFWDMDKVKVIAETDADGGLPNLPRLRFNKEGNLLAVSTAENGIKILATADWLRSLRTVEPSAFEALRTPIEAAAIKIEKALMAEDVIETKVKRWQLPEIVGPPVQCRLVTLPESMDSFTEVARLLYTKDGVGILALGSNGIQKLWKWSPNKQNPNGKATASVVPQHWQPSSGLLMNNDVSGVNFEESVPCIALSENGSYVMSATGGKVSLFNTMTFKVITRFMPPPPTSTYLAFHPQDDNIIAIGMEDSSIYIYNVRVGEVKSKLKGHLKGISGLAFSTTLGILVSSGADAQVCVWSINTWEKKNCVTIQPPAGKASDARVRVQFHRDQTHLLVFHGTQLAIYDASKMDCLIQWLPALSSPISYAVYACNSKLVYVSLVDGHIGVFNADNLKLMCRIGPSAYLSQAQLNHRSHTIYPSVIAAHPQDPFQIAVGLSDGTIKVIEPLFWFAFSPSFGK